MIRGSRMVAAATVLAAVVVGARVSPAHAAASTFAIQPPSGRPYFVISGRAGAVIRSQARVVNTGTQTASVELYPVDATTGQTTGAVYMSDGAPRNDLSAWLTLSRTRVTLVPGQSRLIDFVLRVPVSAGPGQHLGGLVAQPLNYSDTWIKRRARTSFRVNIREIAIVAVQVDLPGPQLEQLSITGVRTGGRPGYQTLEVGLANRGDMLVRGWGAIEVKKVSGQSVFARSFLIDTFVPHTQVEDPIAFDHRLPAGHYLATITIRYGHGHSETRTFGFAVSSAQVAETFGSHGLSDAGDGSTPVGMLILGAAALVLVSCGGSALFFRRR